MHSKLVLVIKIFLISAALTSRVVLAQDVASTNGHSEPWLERELKPESRTKSLLAVMTLEEKLKLVFGYFSADLEFRHSKQPTEGLPNSAGYIPGIERLGIPPQWQTDAGLGVASQANPKPRLRTALPSGLATAATWSTERAFEGGAMIGNEAFLSGFNVQLAGGVNLARDPRNGRNFEYAGEDPLLAGTIVGEQIRGIQSNSILSTVKHFAFNDQETGRRKVDVHISDTAARESDLLAFEIAIKIGNPAAVMCGYNRFRGDYVCESNWLLNQVLRSDWGYRGYVMSDWGGTHSTIPAANAGLDQESGYPFDASPYFADALKEAVVDKHVSKARLDEMVSRILNQMFEKGLFDHRVSGDHSEQIDFKSHSVVSEKDAEEGIVLLKNEKLLPLKPELKSIAMIGGHADVGVLSGGGSSQVYAHGGSPVVNEGPAQFPGPQIFYPDSPLNELTSQVSAKISYNDGSDIAAAVKLARESDAAIIFGTEWNAESIDSSSLSLPGHLDRLIDEVSHANKRTIVVLETGNPILMPWIDNVGAVLEVWYPGTSGARAIANIVTGKVNPSGHLPLTFPASEDQLPRKTIPLVVEGSTVDYDIEGAAVGYKWFELKKIKPLFPFGHGLSFTNFEFSKLSVISKSNSLVANVEVKNVGSVEGKAVAQVYASPVNIGGWESPRRLVGFAKLNLKPGESATAKILIDPVLLSAFKSSKSGRAIEAGRYNFQVGDSSDSKGPSVQVKIAEKSLSLKVVSVVK